MKKLVLATAMVLLATTGHADVRKAVVTGGSVAGVATNGIVAFKGIPFAAPPTGALRWKAPQPVTPWTGVKNASTYGPACMQDPMMPQLFAAPPQTSEDCLFLNVWTPAKSADEK